jgi:hypothetical protein
MNVLDEEVKEFQLKFKGNNAYRRHGEKAQGETSLNATIWEETETMNSSRNLSTLF